MIVYIVLKFTEQMSIRSTEIMGVYSTLQIAQMRKATCEKKEAERRERRPDSPLRFGFAITHQQVRGLKE